VPGVRPRDAVGRPRVSDAHARVPVLGGQPAVTRSEADRRVSELEADWSTLQLVDPVINARREAVL